jgi:phosphoribosyl 1,2-cyclic phosphodiesterase
MWGVRGSIPTPGENTRRYGGNTTCIEVRTDDDALIVLDAGTGIFPLAQTLLPKMPLDVNLFITHTHWDHIQGLPFFTPIFVPGNTITIYGARDIVSGQGVEQAMAVQLQYSFFPVREAELNANLEYRTVNIGEPVTVGDAVITSLPVTTSLMSTSMSPETVTTRNTSVSWMSVRSRSTMPCALSTC